MPANVDPYQGNELDFRVLTQKFPEFLPCCAYQPVSYKAFCPNRMIS